MIVVFSIILILVLLMTIAGIIEIYEKIKSANEKKRLSS